MNWLQERLHDLEMMEQLIYVILAVSAALFIIYLLAIFVRKRAGDSGHEAYLMDIEKISGQDRYPMRKGKPFRIGRVAPKVNKDNALVIAQTTIGRRHAIVSKENDTYWVTDLDSLNGTFVNNHPVAGKSRLENGDMIRFHQYKFRFMLPGADPSDEDMTQLADHDDMESMTELAGDIPSAAAAPQPEAAPQPAATPQPPAQASTSDNPMSDILDADDLGTAPDDRADSVDEEDVTLDNFIDDKTISPNKP